MSSLLLPYDTIIKAHEGDPIAIQAVLDRYAGYIRYFSKMNGYRDRKRERVKTGTSHPRRLRQIQKCDFDRDGTFRTASRTARQVGVLH